jgi:hypothetical protein
MIENYTQYRTTKRQADEFRKRLLERDPGPSPGVDPVVHAAVRVAFASQLDDLEAELTAYEDGRDADVFLFAERTALLLDCLRNYDYASHPVDLGGAMRLVPEVAELLAKVRARLPRPG